MGVGRLWMSARERERCHVVRPVGGGSVGPTRSIQAARRRRSSVQTRATTRRGGPNRLDEAIRDQVTVLLTDESSDFGATLVSENLLQLDGIAVSRESVRRLQIELKLWKPKTLRSRRIFSTA
jgi:hypothetical protein